MFSNFEACICKLEPDIFTNKWQLAVTYLIKVIGRRGLVSVLAAVTVDLYSKWDSQYEYISNHAC